MDFFVGYRLLVPFERAEEQIPLPSELHANILEAFKERDDRVMSPHFERQPR